MRPPFPYDSYTTLAQASNGVRLARRRVAGLRQGTARFLGAEAALSEALNVLDQTKNQQT
jgi:hypothetical protein